MYVFRAMVDWLSRLILPYIPISYNMFRSSPALKSLCHQCVRANSQCVLFPMRTKICMYLLTAYLWIKYANNGLRKLYLRLLTTLTTETLSECHLCIWQLTTFTLNSPFDESVRATCRQRQWSNILTGTLSCGQSLFNGINSRLLCQIILHK